MAVASCTNTDFAVEGSQVACSVLEAVAAAWYWAAETVLVGEWTHLLGKGAGEEAECKVVVEMERRTAIGYPEVEEAELNVAECAESVAAAEAS